MRYADPTTKLWATISTTRVGEEQLLESVELPCCSPIALPTPPGPGQADHNDEDPNAPCGASLVRWPSSRRKRNWVRVVDRLLLEPEVRDALSLNKSGDTVYRSGDAGFELRFVGIEQETSDDARRVMMREIQSLPIDGTWKAVMVHNQLADERGELP